MNLKQNYLALDLELNLDSAGVPKKIIQVGVAIGNMENISGIHTHSWYIDPCEPIVPYITELTGITDEDVTNKSTPLETVIKELGELIQTHQTFVNPVQWGMGDSKELKELIAANNLEFPYFGHREIDVKTIFTYLQLVRGKQPKGGLSSAMARYKLHFEGTPHRADVDAYNTLKFFFTLLDRQGMMEKIVQVGKEIV